MVQGTDLVGVVAVPVALGIIIRYLDYDAGFRVKGTCPTDKS
jgi:hypothetical protein